MVRKESPIKLEINYKRSQLPLKTLNYAVILKCPEISDPKTSSDGIGNKIGRSDDSSLKHEEQFLFGQCRILAFHRSFLHSSDSFVVIHVGIQGVQAFQVNEHPNAFFVLGPAEDICCDVNGVFTEVQVSVVHLNL